LLLIIALCWWAYATTHEGTDDAYVTGHSHEISARINDTVSKVYVNDNDHVTAGQLLVALDPTDFQDRVDVAKASLDGSFNQRESAATSVTYANTNAQALQTTANGAINTAKANIEKAQAALEEAKDEVPESIAKMGETEAQFRRASLDYRRFETLFKQGAVSTSERDSARRDFGVTKSANAAAAQEVARANARVLQAQDQVRVSRADLQQAEGQLQQSSAAAVQTDVSKKDLSVKVSSVKQATASLNDAKVQLSYCQIASPVSGRVGKKAVETGDRVEPGQPLMAIVSDYLWVVANFKETQLERMRPGQYADIRIDAFPHHKFRGVVDSVSPGSGANFALLPSDNATGNFTKIVQRVPVKVLLDPSTTNGFERLIVPGMSVVVSVDLKNSDKTGVLARERKKDVDVR
jgi:membrane fusion protein (multidrug efflux system)